MPPPPFAVRADGTDVLHDGGLRHTNQRRALTLIIAQLPIARF
jgi:hypothetical protein